MKQQARQGAVDRARTRLGFQTVWIGRNDVAQAVNQVCEHVRRNDTSPQQVPVTRCPHGCNVFASLRWHTAMGCSLAAMDMTMDCVTQEDSSQEHTVGRIMPKNPSGEGQTAGWANLGKATPFWCWPIAGSRPPSPVAPSTEPARQVGVTRSCHKPRKDYGHRTALSKARRLSAAPDLQQSLGVWHTNSGGYSHAGAPTAISLRELPRASGA